MQKTDKRLFVLVTALICLSIAWFAQFSRVQQRVTDTNAVVQILDAIRAENADSLTIRPTRAAWFAAACQ